VISRREKRFDKPGTSQTIFPLNNIYLYLCGLPEFQEFLKQTGQQPQHTDPSSDSAHLLHSAKEINVSKMGNFIELSSELAPDISPGELITIRHTHTNKLKLGVVRWKCTMPNLSCRVGIEYFARWIEPCAVQTIADKQPDSKAVPALITREECEDHNNDEVTIPSISFHSGDRVRIFTSTRSFNTDLGALVSG